jgi:hypothetical protein
VPALPDFPGARQIGRIHRKRIVNGVPSGETVCFITSLSRRRANAAALLKLARNHWSIENGLHRVRDVSMGEDACAVCSGNAPQVLATLRNATLTLAHQTGFASYARAFRRHAAHPREAIALITGLEDF